MPGTGGILVIGSANVDLIVRTPHLPARGETVTGGTFLQAMGGKGANQAVAARRAGAAVTLVTSIGNDAHGMDVLDAMRTERIDLTGTRTDPVEPTGVAVILVDEQANNQIAVAPGANFALTPGHLAGTLARLPTFSLLLLQNELAPATLQAILAAAHAAGTPVLLNYAPAGNLTPADLAATQTSLIVNENEAASLLRQPVESATQAHAAASTLRDTGFHFVLVTLGSRGAVCATTGETFHIPAMPVRARDTTAAGDTFSGALASALIRNIPLPAALRFASAAAALSTTRHGAQPSIPTRQQIDAALTAWKT